MINTGWIEKYEVDAVLEAWQPGGYGTISVGNILTEEINPSGRMMDTWAYDYENYPAYAVQSATYGIDVINPIYGQDIYVGYRYFETFAPEEVRYEFGYGLSYTTFDYEIAGTTMDENTISVDVNVKNTGDVSGKEVVEAYYSAPVGMLGNPAYEMGAFAKTPELEPGESCTVTLSFAIKNMASYDDSGARAMKTAM